MVFTSKSVPAPLVTALICVALTACGGGGGGTTDTQAQTSDSGGGGTNPVTPTPRFPGYDFQIKTGDFWEYSWKTSDSSWAQGGSSTSSKDEGKFWLQLGETKVIQNQTAYMVKLIGQTAFTPRWKYLAVVDKQLLGSTDGQTLIPFFNAQSGKWTGGGFFITIPSKQLTIAKSGTIDTANPYIKGQADITDRKYTLNQCEYFPDVGTICGGNDSQSLTEQEYYQAGIGPVGYRYFNSYMYCGGNFCSGGTKDYHLGLTASSLGGQSYPVKAEVEPNDAPANAQTLTLGGAVQGNIQASITPNQGNTTITVTVVSDGARTVTVTPTIEDWYKIVVSTPTTVTIFLSFEGPADADLDLYLVDVAKRLYGYSVHDNPANQKANEKIVTTTLQPGTYYIGVDDAANTADTPIKYVLQAQE